MAQVYIYENKGIPHRATGHKTFDNVTNPTNPVRGDVVLYATDAVLSDGTPKGHGVAYGLFMFNGQQWEWQFYHEYDLAKPGTAVVGAFYNGPLTAAIDKIKWRNPGSTYIVAWVDDTEGGIQVRALGFDDIPGSADPTGRTDLASFKGSDEPGFPALTALEQPASKVFRAELDNEVGGLTVANTAVTPVTPPVAVTPPAGATGSTGTTTPAAGSSGSTGATGGATGASGGSATAPAGGVVLPASPPGPTGPFDGSSVGGWYLTNILSHRGR